MSKIDHSLFTANEHALEQAYGACPKCSSSLQIRRGKSSAFLGCSDYPSCDFTKPLHEYENTDLKTIEGSHCPECNAELVIKKGRYGLFIGCSGFPECHFIDSNKAQADINIPCPSCSSGALVKRANKFGKNFYPCNKYPKCKYALNFQPVLNACPACNWKLMQVKQGADGAYWQCPQKQCQHKMTPV